MAKNSKKIQIDIPDALRQEIVEYRPKTKEEFLVKCMRSGVSEHNVSSVIALCDAYKKPLDSITEYMNAGLTLERIELCLELQSDVPKLTVSLANRFFTALNLQDENVSEVIEGLREGLGDTKLELNRIYRGVMTNFDGDFLEAYHMAIDNPFLYRLVITGRLSLLEAKLVEVGVVEEDCEVVEDDGDDEVEEGD